MEKNFILAGFTQIANALLIDTEISDGAFRTYMVLVMHDIERKFVVWPGQSKIAKYRGKSSRKTVITHLQELERLGLIEKDKRRSDYNGYLHNQYHLVYEWRRHRAEQRKGNV